MVSLLHGLSIWPLRTHECQSWMFSSGSRVALDVNKFREEFELQVLSCFFYLLQVQQRLNIVL